MARRETAVTRACDTIDTMNMKVMSKKYFWPRTWRKVFDNLYDQTGNKKAEYDLKSQTRFFSDDIKQRQAHNEYAVSNICKGFKKQVQKCIMHSVDEEKSRSFLNHETIDAYGN